MTSACPNAACPYRPRLEQAKRVYRTQQADIARLQDLLGRYQCIGLYRLRQAPLDTLTPSGLWCDNFLFQRALATKDAEIQRLTHVIAQLKHLLTPPSPVSQEVP
jgi:hypothetical protein